MKKIVIFISIILFAVLHNGCFTSQKTAQQIGNMVLINGGTFIMGSPVNEQGRKNNETQRQVTVSSFYMSKYNVTQKEYMDVMGENPSFFQGDNLPVEKVSWYDVIEYCNRLSEREGLTPVYTINKNQIDPNNLNVISRSNQYDPDSLRWIVTWDKNANGYRLPTEAEWEYACRAGTTTRYWSGDDEISLSGKVNAADLTFIEQMGETDFEWVNFHDGFVTTSPVGSFTANPWGLYDMNGNVYEWCWDWYGIYPADSQVNPTGAASGSERVIRGGAWINGGNELRSAARGSAIPLPGRYLFSILSFRVVRNAQ